MRVKRKLKPGQPGTKKLLKEFGKQLVCVRYRYDEVKRIRYKTIEIIIEQAEWKPNPKNIPANKIVQIRIRYGELELGRLVRAVGGVWDPQAKLWNIRYQRVRQLGLEDRMVNG